MEDLSGDDAIGLAELVRTESVPLAVSDGLPIGVHFVGRFGDEATRFRLAAQLEAARPRRDRVPPVSV